MKSSLKFREETRKPLFKAKIPLNILGLPFQSSLTAGDSKELSLSIGTSFQSFPAFRIAYQPNDPSNPFSLIVKSGIGLFGSPVNAPLTISAQFDLASISNPNPNPKFFLHFKPQFGDFSLKKSHQSEITAFRYGNGNCNGNVNGNRNGKGGVFGGDDDVGGSIEVIEKSDFYNNNGGLGKMTELPLGCSVGEVVSGVELGAKTVLPIINGAVLKMNWGMKLPEGLEKLMVNPRAGSWPRGIPQLKLNKIGIEHVARDDRRRKEEVVEVEVKGSGSGADVAEACFGLKRQMEMVRAENARLGQALEDLRVEFGNRGRGRGESVGSNNKGGIEDMKKP